MRFLEGSPYKPHPSQQLPNPLPTTTTFTEFKRGLAKGLEPINTNPPSNNQIYIYSVN